MSLKAQTILRGPVASQLRHSAALADEVSLERSETHPARAVVQLFQALTHGITTVILYLMKTAISVPDRVFRTAEDLAARLRVSRSELYSNALAEFIEKHKNDVTTSRLNEVYAKNREPSTLEPEIALLQYHTARRKT